MPDNKVVLHAEWPKARLELLAAGKEFTRQRDVLTRRRMAIPWERVEKSCQFEGLKGAVSLADLFDRRSQPIVYHLMFAPDHDFEDLFVEIALTETSTVWSWLSDEAPRGAMMCPFCVSTIGLIVAGAVSTGGLATLAVKLSRKKSGSTEIIPNSNERSSQYGN